MTRSTMIKSALVGALTLGASGLALAQTAPTPPMAGPSAATVPPPPFMRPAPDPQMQQRMQELRAARMAVMKAQRAMMIDQRIATARQALELTADQQTRFKPVEDAVRGLYEASGPQHPPGTGMTLAPDQRLRVMADRMKARAEALTKLADAVGPFRDSLNDQQKQRFDGMSAMMHGGGMGMMGAGMGMRGMGMRGMGMKGGMNRHHPGCMMGQGQMGQGEMGHAPMMGMGGWGQRGWGQGGMRGWGGMSGMSGMGARNGDWTGMYGMAGMGGDAPGARGMYGMGGMAGMYGWPDYNRVPQHLDTTRPTDRGWGDDQHDGQDDDDSN